MALSIVIEILLSPTGETGGDLWFALCVSVSLSHFSGSCDIFKSSSYFSWNLKHGQIAIWRLCTSFHFVPTPRIMVAMETNRLEILLQMVDPTITQKILHIFSINLKHGQMAIWRLCTSFHLFLHQEFRLLWQQIDWEYCWKWWSFTGRRLILLGNSLVLILSLNLLICLCIMSQHNLTTG